jgi:hypothetical protein
MDSGGFEKFLSKTSNANAMMKFLNGQFHSRRPPR